MYGADDDKREHDDNSKDDHHGATPINPAQSLFKRPRDFRHAQIFSESSAIWAFESPNIEQVSNLAHTFLINGVRNSRGRSSCTQHEFQPVLD
jgi:hypothetical protein